MTSALEHVRYSCGIAGEEVADEVDRLEVEITRLENEVARINALLKRCKNVMECNDPMNYRLIFGDNL